MLMRMESHRHATNVICLAEYLTRRAQPDLPLFARPLRSPEEAIRGHDARRLSHRQMEHRARMLAHLGMGGKLMA
jgi:hypothetical protein